ncbi:MAG: hypothetical protein IKR69_00410 [Bacteroidales bacterium]|nr:hypothetical protein [Bacteroidales bacterium]
MKKALVFILSLGLLVSCDGLFVISDTDSPSGSGNNNGGSTQTGDNDHPNDDNSFGGVIQPKGAIKSYTAVTTRAKDTQKEREETNVYTYDAQGRVVRIDSNQKMYDNGVLVNKDPEDQNFVWIYVYNGTDYEFHNDYAESPKAQWGALNSDWYLTELNTSSYKATYTYNAEKGISKYSQVYNDNSIKKDITFSWNNGNLIGSSFTAVYKDGSSQEELIYSYDRALPKNPTLGKAVDLTYFCFPEYGPHMLNGRGTRQFPKFVEIISPAKANLAKLKYYFDYTLSSDGTRIEKMDRYKIEFPFAIDEETDPTLQMVLQNEVTHVSFTFKYY